MSMGVGRPNSTRFLIYGLSFLCTGTMRAHVQDCFRLDRPDLTECLDGLFGEFVALLEEFDRAP